MPHAHNADEGAPVKTSIVLTEGLLERVRRAQEAEGSLNFSHFVRQCIRHYLEQPGQSAQNSLNFCKELRELLEKIAHCLGCSVDDLIVKIIGEQIGTYVEQARQRSEQLKKFKEALQ